MVGVAVGIADVGVRVGPGVLVLVGMSILEGIGDIVGLPVGVLVGGMV